MGRPTRTEDDLQQMATIGRHLKWLREAKGMVQGDIAKLAGVTQSAWSLYEKGRRAPEQFRIAPVCAKLGITQDYLLYGDLRYLDQELAIALAAAHPELAENTRKRADMDKARLAGKSPGA